jgi:Outer membrane protein beta-barrel domain
MSTMSWGSAPTTKEGALRSPSPSSWRHRAKRVAATASFACALAAPTLAHADEPTKDCEPGSWFCGETQQGKDLQPLPADKAAETKPADKTDKTDKTPPPVVVYQPPPPTVVVQPRDAPPAYYYVPRKAPPKKQWGLNLHLAGAMMGKGRDDNARMGMVGLGLRFRPIPQAAIEGDLDFAAGRDYNGYRRNETAFTLNGLIFLNPKNTTQVYLLGGFGWSGATAVDDRDGYDKIEYKYGYFGVQAGIGLEFRLSKVVALNVDLRGLLRGRIDDNRRRNPEFVSNGKSTNTSGAGLLQGGLTFYW